MNLLAYLLKRVDAVSDKDNDPRLLVGIEERVNPEILV